MSWLFAEIRNRIEEPDETALASIHYSSPLHRIVNARMYVAAGGLDATCVRGTSVVDGVVNEWIVLGMCFGSGGVTSRLLDARDLSVILAARTPAIDELDGHFVIVRWSDRDVECFNDQLGMRTMHIASIDGCTVLSTRLDWIARRIGSVAINLASFGAHWLLVNQMTSDGLLGGVRRLGAGGSWTMSTGTSAITERPWLPDWSNAEDAVARLESAVLPDGLGRSVSLGLSGGLDSRVLLALLMSRQSHSIATHVFGEAGDPDVTVSQLIARRESFEQIHFHDALPDVAACVEMLRDYVGWSCAIEPASAVTTLRYYHDLESRGFAVLDGGLGEIARRSYLKRLLFRGRTAIRNRDAEGMFPFVHITRADVFNDDALRTMKRGAIEQLSRMLAQMPLTAECSESNFVDLMAVRTRFPFFAGLEQARTDASVLCYMPFAQPSFLRAILPDERGRRGGRLLRSIIHKRAPRLEHYPLVKAGLAMPYSMPPLAAIAWARARQRMRSRSKDNVHTRFADHMEVFVRDTAESSLTTTFEGYDRRKIQSLITRYYAGEKSLAAPVNWWMAFEMWRQGVHR